MTAKDRGIEWITVTTPVGGKARTLTTVAELAEFLLAYCFQAKAAQQACLDALDGKIPPEDARAAFAEAVVEAGFHILDVKRPEPTGKPDPVWRRRKPKRRS